MPERTNHVSTSVQFTSPDSCRPTRGTKCSCVTSPWESLKIFSSALSHANLICVVVEYGNHTTSDNRLITRHHGGLREVRYQAKLPSAPYAGGALRMMCVYIHQSGNDVHGFVALCGYVVVGDTTSGCGC